MVLASRVSDTDVQALTSTHQDNHLYEELKKYISISRQYNVIPMILHLKSMYFLIRSIF